MEGRRAGLCVMVCAMRIWTKSITRINRPFLWMAGGAILALLALSGLCALAPINYESPQPKFFLSLFLLLVFEVGWVTLTISFNCWFNLKLTRREQKVREPSAMPANLFLPWPEQEKVSNEQYV
jgi:hypothetical protein